MSVFMKLISLRPSFLIPTMCCTIAFRRNAAPTTDSDPGFINLIYHNKMIKTCYRVSFLKTFIVGDIQTKLGNDAASPPLLFVILQLSCICVSWSLFQYTNIVLYCIVLY